MYYLVSTSLICILLSVAFLQEPLGGAHADSYWTSQQIKTAIVESMDVSCASFSILASVYECMCSSEI